MFDRYAHFHKKGAHAKESDTARLAVARAAAVRADKDAALNAARKEALRAVRLDARIEARWEAEAASAAAGEVANAPSAAQIAQLVEELPLDAPLRPRLLSLLEDARREESDDATSDDDLLDVPAVAPSTTTPSRASAAPNAKTPLGEGGTDEARPRTKPPVVMGTGTNRRSLSGLFEAASDAMPANGAGDVDVCVVCDADDAASPALSKPLAPPPPSPKMHSPEPFAFLAQHEIICKSGCDVPGCSGPTDGDVVLRDCLRLIDEEPPEVPPSVLAALLAAHAPPAEPQPAPRADPIAYSPPALRTCALDDLPFEYDLPLYSLWGRHVPTTTEPFVAAPTAPFEAALAASPAPAAASPVAIHASAPMRALHTTLKRPQNVRPPPQLRVREITPLPPSVRLGSVGTTAPHSTVADAAQRAAASLIAHGGVARVPQARPPLPPGAMLFAAAINTMPRNPACTPLSLPPGLTRRW